MQKLLNCGRLAYLCYLSQPREDRVLYRFLRRGAAASILEIGMGDAVRAGRMIEIVRRSRGVGGLCYTGIDLFELASGGEKQRLSLKAAHCRLKPSGARVRLVPGDACTALAAAANGLGQCDLIVISANQAGESLDRAWFYIPRLLHAATQVFLEQPGEGSVSARFFLLPHEEIRRRAQAGLRRRAAA